MTTPQPPSTPPPTRRPAIRFHRPTWAPWALFAGSALIAISLVIGLPTVSRDGAKCGSGFAGVDHSSILTQEFTNAIEADSLAGIETNVSDRDLENDCANAVATPHIVTYVAIVPGALLVLAAAMSPRRES